MGRKKKTPTVEIPPEPQSDLQRQINEAIANGDFDTAKSLIEGAKQKASQPSYIHNMNSNLSNKKYCRKEPIIPGSFKNTFKDNTKLFPGDKKFDKKHKVFREEVGSRPAAQKVSIKCVICGRTDKLAPSLIPKRQYLSQSDDDGDVPYYRCNRCCAK